MKNVLRTSMGFVLGFVFMLYTAAGWAQWELESERSTLNFVSVKNNSVAEIHSFTSIVGFISAEGSVQVAIDLDSVDTLIQIRDERMREMLFETAKFPAAQVTAQIDPAIIAGLSDAGTIVADIPVTLSLHDQEKKILAPLTIIPDRAGRLRIFTTRPIIVNVSDFGLGAGVEALREIAGLQVIAGAVPVTMSLTFNRAR